jgi:hypothetical protein
LTIRLFPGQVNEKDNDSSGSSDNFYDVIDADGDGDVKLDDASSRLFNEDSCTTLVSSV